MRARVGPIRARQSDCGLKYQTRCKLYRYLEKSQITFILGISIAFIYIALLQQCNGSRVGEIPRLSNLSQTLAGLSRVNIDP